MTSSRHTSPDESEKNKGVFDGEISELLDAELKQAFQGRKR
jgi:hypothetical protein